jgi:hypothetical protein
LTPGKAPESARGRHAGRPLRAGPVPPLARPGALSAGPLSPGPVAPAPDAERDAILQQGAADIRRHPGIELSTDLRDWIFDPCELNLVDASRLFADEVFAWKKGRGLH